jgi:hypothetical protein
MVTLQVLPETVAQPEDQPMKFFPELGVAVSTTEELVGNAAEQMDPQFMAAGALTITPSAAPAVTLTARMFVDVPVGHP